MTEITDNSKALEEVETPAPDLQILKSLRRISQFNARHSRGLLTDLQVTAPQLVCLYSMQTRGTSTATTLAKEVYLSPSTVIGILDRLEEKALITRTRDTRDRRNIILAVTEKGKEILSRSPSPLQALLYQRLQKLPIHEQTAIASALDHIVELMSEIEADSGIQELIPGTPPEKKHSRKEQ